MDLPFIVYGCGKIAENLIESNPSQVYGIMDLYKTGQFFCGKRVLNDEEIINSGIKKIVIAARKASLPVIYRRIFVFCRNNNIEIYDVNHNIISLDLSGKNKLCFRHSENLSNEIKQKILSADVISFDIFDTLIGRRCLYSTDALETFEYEKQVAYPRKEIIEYYYYAKANSKQVFFCSDMYLSCEQICALLNKFDINALPDNIIVSCEHGVEKVNGLFNVLISKVGDKKLLHIGDSYEADYVAAKEHGIESVKIDSRLDVLEKSKWSNLLKYDYSTDNRRVIGELLASDLTLAHMVSPLIYKFASWLKEHSKDFDIILLSARDGSLIDLIRQTSDKYNFPAVYFLVSRTAAVSASMFSEFDFHEIKKYAFSGTEQEFYEKRFAMDSVGCVSDVLVHSEKKRENYLRYIEQLNIPKNARVGFMDLVSGGTCLKNLRKFLPFAVKGMYMAPIEEFYNHDVQDEFLYSETNNCNVLRNYLILEEVFSSDMPTLKCFNDDGKPVYFKEKRTMEQIVNKNVRQAEIIECGKQTFDIDFTKVDLGLCDEILGMVNDSPAVMEDEFCGR